MVRPNSLPKGSPSVHLDALRGFAALSVLLNHWRDALFVDYPRLAHHNPLTAVAYLVAGLGHQWVIVFFVLSGYLVGGERSAFCERWTLVLAKLSAGAPDAALLDVQLVDEICQKRMQTKCAPGSSLRSWAISCPEKNLNRVGLPVQFRIRGI